ncbi:hypothetical protein [Streptomyces synnematoformans]|uniref:PcRGLX/YetA-like C-terminal alpha/alpha toroid domain-containing protein n=1 Tax=Streptomyces synnematoformans TaxID=415721 RepID=A0ABN2ACC8_9ACTN
MRVDGPAVPEPVDEASFVPTNATAQYGLAAIPCRALAGDHLRSPTTESTLPYPLLREDS